MLDIPSPVKAGKLFPFNVISSLLPSKFAVISVFNVASYSNPAGI